MISKKMETALNEQLNKEMYSAYLYMSMSAYSTHIGLKGFANWFMVQYQEEMMHAMKFYNYINDQGGRVMLMAIDAPSTEFESPLDTSSSSPSASIISPTWRSRRRITRRVSFSSGLLPNRSKRKRMTTMSSPS